MSTLEGFCGFSVSTDASSRVAISESTKERVDEWIINVTVKKKEYEGKTDILEKGQQKSRFGLGVPEIC